jgi:hypothetical protein
VSVEEGAVGVVAPHAVGVDVDAAGWDQDRVEAGVVVLGGGGGGVPGGFVGVGPAPLAGLVEVGVGAEVVGQLWWWGAVGGEVGVTIMTMVRLCVLAV